MFMLVPAMERLDGELSAYKRKMKFHNMEVELLVEEVKRVGEILKKNNLNLAKKKGNTGNVRL